MGLLWGKEMGDTGRTLVSFPPRPPWLFIDMEGNDPYLTPFLSDVLEKSCVLFMKPLITKLKHLAPWLMAVAIFAYLFNLYPPGQIWAALHYVNFLWFTLFAVGYFLVVYVVDCWSVQHVISTLSHPISLRDTLLARGVTYLIMIINYPASQAAFAYYLKRKRHIPIFDCLSIFLFVIIVDLMWVVTLAFIGSHFQPLIVGSVDFAPTIRMAALAVGVGFIVWIGFWQRWLGRIFRIKKRWSWLERFRAHRVFGIFPKAKFMDYLTTAVMRIPIHVSIIFSIYVVVMTFDVFIPFVNILGTLPIVLFIGTLPITPGGLGTTNAAMVHLLAPKMQGDVFSSGTITPQELMLTVSLLWMFANYFLKMLLGVILLRSVSRDLFRPTT